MVMSPPLAGFNLDWGEFIAPDVCPFLSMFIVAAVFIDYIFGMDAPKPLIVGDILWKRVCLPKSPFSLIIDEARSW